MGLLFMVTCGLSALELAVRVGVLVWGWVIWDKVGGMVEIRFRFRVCAIVRIYGYCYWG